MRRKLTAFGGGAALVVAAITIPATTATAVDEDIKIDFPTSWAQAASTLSWSINDDLDDICSDPEILIYDFDGDGRPQPAEIITVNADRRSGEIDLALAADNDVFDLGFELECEGDIHSWGNSSFAQISIEKQVAGVPYTNDDFELAVNFGDDDGVIFEDTAIFSPSGGTATYYQFDEGTWNFDETVDGGADNVSISPETLPIIAPGRYAVTVTNTFHSMNVFPTVNVPTDFISTSGEQPWENADDYPPMCEDGDVTTEGYVFSENANRDVEPAFDVSVAADGNSGTIDVANAPGTGYYTTTVVCENDGYTFNYILNTAVDVFTLTKTVQGDAPADANFEIEVTASYPVDSDDGDLEHGPNTQTLSITFGADGGEQKIFHHTGEIWAYWTTEETDDGGAESVSIEERNYVDDEGDAFATVTNVFASSVPEEDDPEEEAAEAPRPTPVKKEPSYTG